MSGHVETIRAHQVIMPSRFAFAPDQPGDDRIMFHGEINGRWMLILAAHSADIRTVRNVTVTEVQP